MTSQSDIKLLSQIGQHYYRQKYEQPISVVEVPSTPASENLSGIPSQHNPSSTAITALATSAALVGMAAVAGLCAARSLDYRLKYDYSHRQVLNFTDRMASDTITIQCINMPQRHVTELAEVLRSSSPFVPERTPLTLYSNAGGLNRGGGATSKGGTSSGDTNAANNGGGDDVSGLNNVKRDGGGAQQGSQSVGSRFLEDCKSRALEAYERLCEKRGDSGIGVKPQIACLTEHFVVLVNGNEPDIFYTITDISRRFKGQRISLAHCLVLTMDGTNTKTFYTTVTGTVTDEWLKSILDGETENQSKSLQREDAILESVAKLIPFEVLYQPNESSYAPSTRPLAYHKLVSQNRKTSSNEIEASFSTSGAIPIPVHTSNELEYVFFNSTKEEGSNTKGITKFASWLFNASHGSERRQAIESLYRQYVPIGMRGADVWKSQEQKTQNGNGIPSPSAAPLFSPRFLNYQRLASYLQYGRQEDPEYYPFLSVIARLTGGWVAKDTTAELNEESIDPQQLFSLSRSENHHCAGIAMNRGFTESPGVAQTPQMRTMLTPVDLKRLRQWIDVEWAFASRAWAVVREAPRPLRNTRSNNWLHISQTLFAQAAQWKSLQGTVDRTIAYYSRVPDSSLYAFYVNIIDIDLRRSAVLLDATTMKTSVGDWVKTNFPTLFAQCVFVENEATLQIQYNTAGHINECTTALIEQCRILQLSGLSVLSATMGVLLRQGLADFTALPSVDHNLTLAATRKPLLPSFFIGLKAFISKEFLPLTAVPFAYLSEGKVEDARKLNKAMGIVAKRVLRTGLVGICTSTTVHTVQDMPSNSSVSPSSTPQLSPSGGSFFGVTSPTSLTASGADLKFSRMASHYVSLHHPALRKRGLCPLTDNDAKDPTFCFKGNRFVLETYVTDDTNAMNTKNSSTKRTATFICNGRHETGTIVSQSPPCGTGLWSALRSANIAKAGQVGQQLYFTVFHMRFGHQSSPTSTSQ